MIGRKTIIGLALVCALALGALAAQGASAAGNGQTIFECASGGEGFSDAHCDNTGTGFHHAAFPETSTEITLSNEKTKESTTAAEHAVLFIGLLHGFTNVEITCTNVEGTGTAKNSLSGTIHKGSGSGTILFNNGTGVFCHTNQSGCEGGSATQGARVGTAANPGVKVEGESVEGSTLKEGGVSGGHGLKFKPQGETTQFTTVTFEGTCGLHSFGAIPVNGSVIATAGGTREGRGATAWLIPGEMESLTVGGSAATLEGKATLKRKSTGNALTFTTS